MSRHLLQEQKVLSSMPIISWRLWYIIYTHEITAAACYFQGVRVHSLLYLEICFEYNSDREVLAKHAGTNLQAQQNIR